MTNGVTLTLDNKFSRAKNNIDKQCKFPVKSLT